MITKTLKLLCGVFLIAAATLVSSTLSAQTPSSSGLAISPPLFELNANPGDTLNHEIRVDNLTDEPLNITVDTRNFTALGEEGQVDLTAEESGSFSLASWVDTTPTSTTLPAKESQTFKFSVVVPNNGEPGGHFGSIIFKTDAKPVEGGSGAAVSQEIGALLLVKVAGDITEEAEISSFEPTKNFWEQRPVELISRIENTGNVHFKPRGTITITNMRGKEVANLPVEERNILPDSVRRLSTTWNGGLTIGRFTANLAVTYGNDNQVITSTSTFYIVPVKLIAAIMLGLAIAGYVIFKSRRRLHLAINALRGK